MQTEHVRHQIGAGLLLTGGISSILKTAAERGRLQGSVFRALNWSVAGMGALMALTLSYALRNGIEIRPAVFWPLLVYSIVCVPVCIALTQISSHQNHMHGHASTQQ